MSDTRLRLGCQTITWGNDQQQFLPRMFEATAEAGYQGVEIGFRRIQNTTADQLKHMLEAHNLTLLGTHLGGNLEDTSQAAGERAILDDVLDYLDTVGATRLMYSGLRHESDDQFKRDLNMLAQSAEKCQQRGVQLLYHNHDWEFDDGGRVIETLINDTDIGFCPDIGWVMRGLRSVDRVLPLLDRIKHRIGAIHMKDLATVEPADTHANTVMLGEGPAPLREVAAWAKQHHPGLWLVAEQDRAEGEPADAIRINAQFLHELI